MKNFEIKNIKSHPSLSLAKANASRDLQINFNQAEDALTIPTESRHDHKCGFATQRGRSMIEMLGVLAIIGVLSVGGIAGYSKAMQKYRINKTIEQITLIAGNVRSFFAPQKNYDGVACDCSDTSCGGVTTGDGCPVLKKAKIFPDEMLTLDNTGKITAITNGFGYNVDTFTATKTTEGDARAFSFNFVIGNNPEACIEIVTEDWTTSNVSFIGVWNLDGVDNYHFANLPVSIDDAVEACSHAKSDTLLRFYFDAGVDYYRNFFSGFTWR